MASTSQGESAGQKAEQGEVEMSTLPSQQETAAATASSSTPAPAQEADASAGAEQQPQPDEPQPPAPVAKAPNRLTRAQSEALGPATESPIHPPLPTPDRGPTLSITLMLTTGARHPYKIDEKYLRNRKVEMPEATGEAGFDPREISGYKLKELIWTDWRQEWEPRPQSPSSIRLILLGRFVEDKSALKDLPFKLDDTNVVHMTVKPADFLEDDDAAGKGAGKGHSIRGRDGEDRGAGCRCVIL